MRRLGVPLVVTVHQLREATQPARRWHDDDLRTVLATAEVVLTLTPSAADEIADRYGRTAIVLAHRRWLPIVSVAVVNIGRALPSFAIIALLFPLSIQYGFGLGFWPTCVALVR